MSNHGEGRGLDSLEEDIDSKLENAFSSQYGAGSSVESEQRRDIVVHANYELFIAGLLIVQIVNSALLLLPLSPEQREIVFEFWIVISGFLMIDVFRRWHQAPNKRRYFISYSGWLQLLGSVPVPFFAGVRLFAMVYMLRRLRRGEFREIGKVVVSRHAQTTLLAMIFLAILFFEFGAILILSAEQSSPQANILTSEDAMWWSVVTISTVGYGDNYPTTYAGRLIGIVLIISGVGLFTSTTSFMARWFMRPRKPQRLTSDSPEESTAPSNQVQQIRLLLSELEDSHQQAIQELEDRLNLLEITMSIDDGTDQ